MAGYFEHGLQQACLWHLRTCLLFKPKNCKTGLQVYFWRCGLSPSTAEKNTMKIWYFLVDSQGSAYKGCTHARVAVEEDAIVDDVRDAIKFKDNDILPNTSAGQLTLYKSKQDFDINTPITKLSTPAKNMGKVENTPIYVVVPDMQPPGIVYDL